MPETPSLPTPVPKAVEQPVRSQIEVWLREAQDGSRSALGRVLEASRKYLLLVANRALDDNLQAKVGPSDLVQDTYVEVQRDFARFTGTTEEELFAWLTTILVNRVANNERHYRTQKHNIRRELDPVVVEAAVDQFKDEAQTPAAQALADEEQRRIRAAMAQLSDPFREVLIERTWQRASFAQIAARRNCSADAARKLWSRAVMQLQRILDGK